LHYCEHASTIFDAVNAFLKPISTVTGSCGLLYWAEQGKRGIWYRYIPKFSDSEPLFPAKKHGSPKLRINLKIVQKTQNMTAKNFPPNESEN